MPHLSDALLHLKAGALLSPGILSVKANLRRTGEKAIGVVVLYDTAQGEVSAIMDSADITSMRTAALASIAAQALAPKRPLRVAMIGIGPVAVRTLAALSQSFEITSIKLWSRDPKRAADFATTHPQIVKICATPAEAVADATLIVTATPSSIPLLKASDISPGTLILALGADSPGKRELDASILETARIITDQTEDALRVGESAYLPDALRANIIGEIGDVLAGKLIIPVSDQYFTVFDSVGSAIIDASAAQAIAAEAVAQGLGMSFNFGE